MMNNHCVRTALLTISVAFLLLTEGWSARRCYDAIRRQGDSVMTRATNQRSPFAMMMVDKTDEFNGSSQSHDGLLTLTSGESISIRRRTVPLTKSWNVTIWEQFRPAETISSYYVGDDVETTSHNDEPEPKATVDPFGLVMWPGSVIAARKLKDYQSSTSRDHIQNSTILILGAGCGVEALAAASLGGHVVATDIHPTTLDLLRYSASRAGFGEDMNLLHTQFLDFADPSCVPLPPCDILVAADVLYSPSLAKSISERCYEVLQWPSPPKILVTDSQRFGGTDFVPELVSRVPNLTIQWEHVNLEHFTGSGVVVDEDQTYNATVRFLAIGFGD